MKRVGRKEPTERKGERLWAEGSRKSRGRFLLDPKEGKGGGGERGAAEEATGAETRACRTPKGLGFDASFTP